MSVRKADGQDMKAEKCKTREKRNERSKQFSQIKLSNKNERQK